MHDLNVFLVTLSLCLPRLTIGKIGLIFGFHLTSVGIAGPAEYWYHFLRRNVSGSLVPSAGVSGRTQRRAHFLKRNGMLSEGSVAAQSSNRATRRLAMRRR